MLTQILVLCSIVKNKIGFLSGLPVVSHGCRQKANLFPSLLITLLCETSLLVRADVTNNDPSTKAIGEPEYHSQT